MQNGGYVQPPPIKRQFRDPHGDWWDKQERRNYGEPAHEDNDQLGIFTPYEYTWVSPRKGLLQLGMFVAAFLSVCYAIKLTYPDVPSYPKEFEGGLERELGGSGGIRVRIGLFCCAVGEKVSLTTVTGKSTGRPRTIPERSGCGLSWACTLEISDYGRNGTAELKRSLGLGYG